ncbi:MAG: hypothetical protein V4689_12680 [Verrucomicrobiota bacterium]
MKSSSIIRLLLAASACMTASLSAQNFPNDPPSAADRAMRLVPFKAEGIISETRPEVVVQNARTLDSQDTGFRRVESVIDLDVLKQASIYQKIPTGSIGFNPEETALRDELELISATYREPAKATTVPDGREIALAVRQRILMNPTAVLEIVESEVAANPSCACEIVKSAIQAALADSQLVVSIVETAIQSSPENLRLISQCAIAASPESLSAVQALLAELDPNGGEGSSAKSSSKSAKSTSDVVSQAAQNQMSANPLDLPPLYPIAPPPILPPHITQVNP